MTRIVIFGSTSLIRKVSILLLLLGLSFPSYGFGAKGHRIIAEIAQNHLSENASTVVFNILAGESLAQVSTWADEMRYRSNASEFWSYDYSSNWHFINIEPNQSYAQSKKNTRGDAYTALLSLQSILENQAVADNIIKEALELNLGDIDIPQNQRATRQLALKFLVHLVADLHQPLHLGYEADQGGNQIQVQWLKRQTNLHSVWDSRLIESLSRNEAELKQKLDEQIRLLNKSELLSIQQTNPLLWINEGLQLRNEIYAVDRFDSKFDEAYIEEFTPLIETQLIKAGLRLAAVLNKLFE